MDAKTIVEARKIAGRPEPVDAFHSCQENERGRDIESVLFDTDEEIKQLPALERGDCSGGKHADLVGSTASPDFKEKRPLPRKEPGGDPSVSLAVPPLDVSARSYVPFMDPSNPGVVLAQRDSHQGKSQANRSSTTAATVRPPDQNFKHGHCRGQMTSLSGSAPPFRSQEIKPSAAATPTSHSASSAALNGPRVLPSSTLCFSHGPLTPEGHKTPPLPCVQKIVLHQMQPALVKTYAQASAYAPAQIHYRHPTRTHTFPQAQAHAQAQIQARPLPQRQPQQKQLPDTRNPIQPQFQPAAATATATATAAPRYHACFGRPEQDVRRTFGHSTNLQSSTTITPTTQLPTTQPNPPAAHPRARELTGRSGTQIALPRRPLISAARGSSGRARQAEAEAEGEAVLLLLHPHNTRCLLGPFPERESCEINWERRV
jgi:hypothetical protein